MRIKPYNRDSAVAYAQKWAFDRNPAYYDFQNIGGDCTNFASQCIFAGAGVMNYTRDTGWYYRSVSDRAAAWTSVEFLYKFLLNNKSVGPFAHEVSQYEALHGDVVQLGTSNGDFFHTPVIIAVTPIILTAAHTYDAIDKPLTLYNYDIVRFLHIDGIRTW